MQTFSKQFNTGAAFPPRDKALGFHAVNKMTYNPSIPQSGDVPASSQSQILNNFGALNTIFSQDHITFNAGADNGEHKQVTFNAPQAAPAPAGSKGEATTQTVSGISELFYTNATKNSQLTFSSLTTSGGSGGLPGGLQIRSGTGGSNGSGFVNSFSPQFPTACISVVASGQNFSQPTNDIKVTAVSATNFTAKSTLGESIYYVAIGY